MENSEILKRPALDPSAIDGQRFTASLLREVLRAGLLDEAFAEGFQEQLLALLGEQLKASMPCESSSVPAEFADERIDAIGYCIDAALKRAPTLDQSAAMLREQPAAALYAAGKELLDSHAKAAEALLSRVRATRLKTVNIGYNLTLDATFPDFLREWKRNPYPHDFVVITEYPLSEPCALNGIAGVHARLAALALENRFCARFPTAQIEALLSGYARAHRASAADAYVNLFDLALQNLLCNRLLGRQGLSMDVAGRTALEEKLRPLADGERAALLSHTADLLLRELCFEHPKLESYVRSATARIARMLNLARGGLGELATVTTAERSLVHTDGERLDHDAFTLVADEVLLAETPEEKASIIRNELRSLQDLADLLASGIIFEEEFEGLYAQFDDVTLALLLAETPVAFEGENPVLESDLAWQTQLARFVAALEADRKDEVLFLYNSLAG